MRDTITQWFIINKPYETQKRVLIDDEIAAAEEVLKKLKKAKKDGYLVKNRKRRIPKAAGHIIKFARSVTNNTVIGYELPENADPYKTIKIVAEIYTFLLQQGYNPEFGCLREHVTKGACTMLKGTYAI